MGGGTVARSRNRAVVVARRTTDEGGRTGEDEGRAAVERLVARRRVRRGDGDAGVDRAVVHDVGVTGRLRASGRRRAGRHRLMVRLVTRSQVVRPADPFVVAGRDQLARLLQIVPEHAVGYGVDVQVGILRVAVRVHACDAGRNVLPARAAVPRADHESRKGCVRGRRGVREERSPRIDAERWLEPEKARAVEAGRAFSVRRLATGVIGERSSACAGQSGGISRRAVGGDLGLDCDDVLDRRESADVVLRRRGRAELCGLNRPGCRRDRGSDRDRDQREHAE